MVGPGSRGRGCAGCGRGTASSLEPPAARSVERSCRDAHRASTHDRSGPLSRRRASPRNWLVLRGLGTSASPLDAIALLIAIFTLGQLPIGPSLGAAAAVLILGRHGVATAAAAGVLLTATATVGSLCYAGWALVDQLIARQP